MGLIYEKLAFIVTLNLVLYLLDTEDAINCTFV